MSTWITTPFTPRSTAVEEVSGIDRSDHRIIVTGATTGTGLAKDTVWSLDVGKARTGDAASAVPRSRMRFS
ncbi:hypothetical protein [Streptomyces sp. NPDC055400]